ncbi:MAG: SMC family ATPase, partial [Egibacteraceae bacterium]
MRPVTLTIQGLRSFREPVTIDFADRRLVAIIGDTGAGKSSILEALTWALYGNATWTKQAAAVLLGDGAPQMRVRLDFVADGSTWRVTRALKRRQDGTAGVTSAELVCLDGDRPAADGVRPVDAAVARLLGLDWEAFTRTVVLPQGQFARLLTEGDVDRMRILAQIWRTDELVAARAQAGEALADLTAHLERLRGRREGYPADVAAELAAARTRLAQAEATDAAVGAAAGRARTLREAGEQARATAQRVRAALAQLDAVLEDDPAARVAGLAEVAAGIDEEQRALDARVDEQVTRIDALERPDDDGPDRAATDAGVATLGQVAASLDDLAGSRRRIDDLTEQARRQHSEAEQLQQTVQAAAEQLRRAEAEVERWRRVDAAATAARALHPGDDCPVCARALPAGWTAPDATDLETATEALDAARHAHQEADKRRHEAATAAEHTATQADGETAQLARRLAKVAEAAAQLPAVFRPRLPDPFTVATVAADDLTDALVADACATAAARKAELDARDEQRRAARDALHQLRDARTGLADRRHREVTEPATRLRARLEHVCTRIRGCEDAGVTLAGPVPAIGESLADLERDARTVAELAAATRQATETAAAGADTQAAQHDTAIAGLLAEVGAATVEELTDRHVQARADADRARIDVARLDALAPTVAALDEHLARGATAAGGLADLKTLLQDGRFVRWLTLRRSRALLAVASTLLDELTGGRYAFADITDEHDEWRIFDTRTGYARSPRTLSGGESFVASLALALGMVEMVARAGGRLDALFLDEGFGALDRDNLDAAIDALEAAAGRGRMVGVISHVQAVAERLPDVLAVDRTPAGSQVRWLGAAERDGVAAAGL